MEIQVSKLREALELLSVVVPKKTSLPVVANVLLTDGMMVATDLETMVTLEFPEAVDPMLLPHREVTEFLKFIPGDQKSHAGFRIY